MNKFKENWGKYIVYNWTCRDGDSEGQVFTRNTTEIIETQQDCRHILQVRSRDRVRYNPNNDMWSRGSKPHHNTMVRDTCSTSEACSLECSSTGNWWKQSITVCQLKMLRFVGGRLTSRTWSWLIDSCRGASMLVTIVMLGEGGQNICSDKTGSELKHTYDDRGNTGKVFLCVANGLRMTDWD